MRHILPNRSSTIPTHEQVYLFYRSSDMSISKSHKAENEANEDEMQQT